MISGRVGAGTMYNGGTSAGTLTLSGTGTGQTGTYTCSTSATISSSLLSVTSAPLNPAQWTLTAIRHPMASIAGLAYVPNTFFNPAQSSLMAIVDHWGRSAHSEDGTNWVINRVRPNITNRSIFPTVNDGRKKYLVSAIV